MSEHELRRTSHTSAVRRVCVSGQAGEKVIRRHTDIRNEVERWAAIQRLRRVRAAKLRSYVGTACVLMSDYSCARV